MNDGLWAQFNDSSNERKDRFSIAKLTNGFSCTRVIAMSTRTVLITGASAGLGQACADHLAHTGWTVVGASRRGTSGKNWAGITMDVDSDASVLDGVTKSSLENGRLDAVVACAGWGAAGAVEETPMSDAKAQFETNFWGCVRVVQAALPIMRRQGHGRIVLMSSIGGLLGIPYQAFYAASKFALEGYAESLAYEVAPFNIQVTLVEPGNFKTDFTQNRRMVQALDGDPYKAAREKAIGVMERDEINGANPMDVAKVVQRVLNDKSQPRRASVGKLDERMGIMGKRLLPFRIFEKAAKSSLGV
jgi:NAD(P)-dependent dehydrogenase (short-subunit alcohol dehydrogenase family)